MDELMKDKILLEFELASSYINDESLLENMELLKSIANSDNPNDMCYLNLCMALMKVLTKEIKLKSKGPYEIVCALSEEEKCYLKSIYK